jgi:phosphoglycerol transferase
LLSAGKKSYEMFFDGNVSNQFKSVHQDNDWIGSFYKRPEVSVSPRHNLVWIYFESLESRNVNRENSLRKGVKDLESEFVSLNGTGWTFAGILSSQCGIPLLLDPFSRRGYNMEGASCLADVLSQHSSSTHFSGGADTGFSGKGQFLSAHSFGNVSGKQDLQKVLVDAPPSAFEHWGYNDDHVLPILESDVLRLHRNREKFYYAALTLDTHGPLIYTDFCRDQGFQNTEAGIYSCGLKRIQNVIAKWEAAGVLQNTTVVVSGDHPAMRTYHFGWTEIFKKERIKREKVYFYVRPASSFQGVQGSKKSTNLNHFDLFPTVFHFIGGKLAGDSAGLGRNIMSSPSLSDSYQEDEFNYVLTRPSGVYETLRTR